ncbi:hypothetical protein CIPAW_14G104800 [Carya illinoinensis]|uniref:Threonine dehydratase n=1 Tax=Carya illinoinensis TaxID=32201 RepID=A0A8T1NDE2_CARIL|nr:hypothetical protein CIPAW_14G104800 [Carya illinoinensis]
MEVLCFTSSPGVPLSRSKPHHSPFPPMIRTLTLNKYHKTRPSSVVTTTLTNPALQNSHKSLRLAPLIDTTRPETSDHMPPQLMKVSAESLVYESGFLGVALEKLTAAAGDGGDGFQHAIGYLPRILSSKVYDIAIETPMEYASKLSERLGVHIWLKREDLQPGVFSFKLRGAYNMMAKLSREQLDRGVICSSAGNHAQGVALSAQKLGCDAVVAMPVTTYEIKLKTVERLGAKAVLVGDCYADAQQYAKQRAKEEGRTFVPGFDHPDVIAGQGTVGMEIVRQMPTPLHAIFVPVGGGGLIAGIAAYVKTVALRYVKIIGVEPYDANSMALSLFHGQRIMLDNIGRFADGVAMEVVGEETFKLCRELMDGVVLVNQDAICASIKDMFEEKRSILEPAGALALPGAEAYCNYYGLKGENVVAITSGANMTFDRLSLVSQHADVGRRQVSVPASYVPEKWGKFKQFCEPASDGSSIENEILCRFVIPERPGALMKLLDAFGGRWNISMLNYQRQGQNGGDVLVGLKVLSSEMDEFKALANSLGSDYAFEISNETLPLLLHQ